MSKRLSWLMPLCLVACAPQSQFEGTWSGDVSTSTSCTVGQGAVTTDAETWSVAQEGSQLTISDAPCSPFYAAAEGSSATVTPAECEDTSSPSGAVHNSLKSGTISLQGGRLVVSLDLEQSGAVSCTASSSGQLTKQP